MTTHSNHHYSVTVQTNDLPILHCLRSLADYGQETGNKRIVWGGTKKMDWEMNQHCVTFHFSEPKYRSKFLNEASRLLPEHLWEKINERNDDPAVRQGKIR